MRARFRKLNQQKCAHRHINRACARVTTSVNTSRLKYNFLRVNRTVVRNFNVGRNNHGTLKTYLPFYLGNDDIRNTLSGDQQTSRDSYDDSETGVEETVHAHKKPKLDVSIAATYALLQQPFVQLHDVVNVAQSKY